MLQCAIVKVYFPNKGYGFLIDGGYTNSTSEPTQSGDIFFDTRAIKYSLVDQTRRFPKIITNYNESYAKNNNLNSKHVNLFKIKAGMLVAYQPDVYNSNKAFSIVHPNTYLQTCKKYYSTYFIPLNRCEEVFNWWVYKQLLTRLEPEIEFQYKVIQNILQEQLKSTTNNFELFTLQTITQQTFQTLCVTLRGLDNNHSALQAIQKRLEIKLSLTPQLQQV